MQIVSIGDNLHEVSNLIFSKKKKKNYKWKISRLSSVEFAHNMVSVKYLRVMAW